MKIVNQRFFLNFKSSGKYHYKIVTTRAAYEVEVIYCFISLNLNTIRISIKKWHDLIMFSFCQ